MKTHERIGFLFAACIASSLAACGGDSTPAPPYTPLPIPSPPVPPPPPPPAPTSGAPYWLAAESGLPRQSLVNYANGTQSDYIAALTLVDPANPTAPVELAAAGTWQLLSLIPDGAVSNGVVADAHVRYVVVAKDDRLWKIDLAKGTGTPQPVALSGQTLSGAAGICIARLRVYQALPAATSTLVFRSPGNDGACGTADDPNKAVRLDASPTSQPAIVDGEPLEAIYNTSGGIDGWVVRKGGALLRQNATLDAPSPATLKALGSPDDVVRPVGIAGATRPGALVMTIKPAGGPDRELWTLDLASGSSRSLGYSQLNDWIHSIGSDATHFYFVTNGREIRRFDHANPGLVTVEDFVVQEDPLRGLAIGSAKLTNERVVYDAYDWLDTGFLRATPKNGRSKVGDPSTPQPTTFSLWSDEWTVSGPAAWHSGGDLMTMATFDGQASLSFSGRLAGTVASDSLDPTASPAVAVLLAESPMPSATSFASTTLKLYSATDGRPMATYGALPPLAYTDVSARLLRSDAPGLISARSGWGIGIVDLYFINGTSPGLTRVTNHVKIPATTAPYSFEQPSRPSRSANAAVPTRGPLTGDAGAR